MRCRQQIGEAQRVVGQPGMAVEQAANLADAVARIGQRGDERALVGGPVEARGDDAIARDRHRDRGITYQLVMPISWFIRAAARGS